MSENYRKYGLFYLFLCLCVVVGFIFYFEHRLSKREFTFTMVDVGQGDALYIESPTGTQMLVDGGPPRKLIQKLSKIMPPFDRTIDSLVITNPDQDHIAGFSDVLKRYRVGAILEPGTYNDTETYKGLLKEAEQKNVRVMKARSNMRLHLGGGLTMDILFPDRDVSSWETNDGSLVARLYYGETSIILTGDATTKTEKFILEDYSETFLESDILKVGHHGSLTSTSEAFLEAVRPEYALISSGEGNKYGHPNKVILGELEAKGVQVLRTDQLGNIKITSDGKAVKFHLK